MHKKIMIIGALACGKTTLANYINKDFSKIFSTQQVTYGKYTIDVPGAYISSENLRNHIIAEAQNAKCVVMLLSTDSIINMYPPNFAKIFQKVIGVVSKSDINTQNIEKCHIEFEKIGVKKPYFNINIYDTNSLDKLINVLNLDGE